jgi:hypothetical protein
MFDTMTGAVGFAMHADRLATAARNRRLAEAGQGSARVRRASAGSVRASLARALVALAAWLSPSVTRSHTANSALAR